MKHIVYSIMFVLCCVTVYGQSRKIKHNPSYDNKPFHLGITLGFNTLDYRLMPSSYLLFSSATDSVYGVEPQKTVGINLGIVSDLRMGEYLSLRFLPGMIFGQRNLNYTLRNFYNTSGDISFVPYTMKVPSIYLDAPLMLKVRATRINNYRPYLIGGIALKYDVETKRVLNENTYYTIRQKPLDYFYEFGFGVDWYLVYFKLSTEFKFSFGLTNILVPDTNEFARVIEELKSRMFIVSFHFE